MFLNGGSGIYITNTRGKRSGGGLLRADNAVADQCAERPELQSGFLNVIKTLFLLLLVGGCQKMSDRP